MFKLSNKLFLIFLLYLVPGCALPQLEDRTTFSALTEVQARETRLGKALEMQLKANSGKVGIYPVQEPTEAYTSRVALIRQADRTLDVQSYIWQDDTTGNLIFLELQGAANRGVRVRLLLDDNGIAGLDEKLNALDAHPNIEVRLFNPFVVRKPKWLGYLVDFSRVNRRMHNKTLTADNQVTIAGGRNIGDPYFDVASDTLFTDLDLLCVGAVVGAVSRDFDGYWQSESAYPVNTILGRVEPDTVLQINSEMALLEKSDRAIRYVKKVRNSAFADKLMQGTLPMYWASARLVSDDPAKALDQASSEDLLVEELRRFVGQPRRAMNVVSPYFVPTEKGVEFLSSLAQQGVKVRILTNSLEATDVAAVHSGYAKSRKELLKAGVQLFEMRRTPAADKAKRDKRNERNKRNAVLGRSGSSLHSKMFSVDGSRVFVGSFNFDPRSVNLNTEMGFLIDSPGLAAQIDEAFRGLPGIAYEVVLDEEDSLVWIERQDGQETRHYLEPKATVWRRVVVFFSSLLPIKDLL